MNLEGKTVTVVFKRENGRPTPEYSTEIDELYVGRVKFCIPSRLISKAGNAVLQIKVYGENSLLNSVVLPFEIERSIDDCDHDGGCKPVTLSILQKFEEAMEEMAYLRDEMEEAEADRSEQFAQWEDTIEDIEAGGKDEIVIAATAEDFPKEGEAEKIYWAQEEQVLYQWDAEEGTYSPLASGESAQIQYSAIHGGNAYGSTDGTPEAEWTEILSGSSSVAGGNAT